MRTDVLIIGGGPSGLNTAIAIKKKYPKKEVLVVKERESELFPPKIPYIFGTLESLDEAFIKTNTAENLGIKFLKDEVEKMNFKDKEVTTTSNRVIEYEKLILAIGSLPIIPRIKGADQEGVFVVSKDMEYLKKVLKYIESIQRVLIVGGGFIGVEVCDEMRKIGKEITIVEAQEHLLSTAFDENISEIVEERFSKQGVEVKTNTIVEGILGNGKVSKVRLSNGEEVKTDMVILSIGYKPNVELIKDTEMQMGHSGAIWVDDYMRTNVEDVFAIGDCAEHRDFFTGKYRRLMLVSVAISDSEIVSENLYNLRPFKKNDGNLSVFSMSIEGLTFDAVGLNSKTALKEGFKCIIGESGDINENNATYVKLLFSEKDKILLGAQIVCKSNIGEMLGIIKNSIQNKSTISDLSKNERLLTEKMQSMASAVDSASMKISNRDGK